MLTRQYRDIKIKMHGRDRRRKKKRKKKERKLKYLAVVRILGYAGEIN
jgi:hypothetical protein